MSFTLPEKIPLVVAPFKTSSSEDDQLHEKYILFEYAERTPASIESSPPPPSSPGSSSILFRTELDSVPSDLKDYLVPYYVFADDEQPKFSQSESERSFLPVHLRNLAVIDSTYSGTHKSSDLYFAILLPLLKAFGLAHVYVATTGPSTISNHAKSFSSSSTVVLLSGDTAIHEFVNSLTITDEKPRLNVVAIPTGTGNALSSSIGHNGIPHAISRLFIGKALPLTNFKVDFPEGSFLQASDHHPINSLQSLVVASWGFHAALVADSDSPEYRAHGPARFELAAKANILKDQRYRGNISFSSDGQFYNLDQPHSYVLFTPITSLEKTFRISPLSRPPSSGEIYLVEIGHLDGDSIMNIMWQVYEDSKHIHDPRVLYKKLDNDTEEEGIIATIQIDEKDVEYRRWCIDGRIVVVASGGAVRLHKPSTQYNGWDLYIVV